MTLMSGVGWIGSALLVYSLLQTRVLRFRVLNLAASLILVCFNTAIGVWPMVAMNAVIAVINVGYIGRLLRGRHDERSYAVVPVGPAEPYLRRVLLLNANDIRRYNPGLRLDDPWHGAADRTRLAFLVLSGHETVGVVLAHRTAAGTAQVDLDYVLPRFRDFTPGEFVYRAPGPFTGEGVSRVLAPTRMLRAERYLASVGFRPEGGVQVLDLTPA